MNLEITGSARWSTGEAVRAHCHESQAMDRMAVYPAAAGPGRERSWQPFRGPRHLVRKGAAAKVLEVDIRTTCGLSLAEVCRNIVAEAAGEREVSDDSATAFKGTFAELYDRYLVPMNFAPCAEALADRVNTFKPQKVLETAAGTGVVTQALQRKLPTGVAITATDLSQPMIDLARAKSGMADVTWRQADATKLPFPDASFDIVVCQFGVMFFPDKQASSQEAFRVLRQGGKYLFAVWDSWPDMPTAPLGIAAKVVGEMLGRDPVSLMNPPYHNESTIRANLIAANFISIEVERISLPAKAASARDAAVITVHGSLIANAIEATAPERLDEATEAVERALRSQFGAGEIVGANRAIVITAEKSDG